MGYYITASTKNFDILHPDPAKTGMRLRHWCLEGDTPGGGLLYRKQVAAIRSGTTDLIVPGWFQHLAKNVMVFCNGYKHHGTAWGVQDELDPNVIHITIHSHEQSLEQKVISDGHFIAISIHFVTPHFSSIQQHCALVTMLYHSSLLAPESSCKQM